MIYYFKLISYKNSNLTFDKKCEMKFNLKLLYVMIPRTLLGNTSLKSVNIRRTRNQNIEEKTWSSRNYYLIRNWSGLWLCSENLHIWNYLYNIINNFSAYGEYISKYSG